MALSETIVSILTIGITGGMLIFLVAAGLTLIFGILDIINFAHGSFYMLGAYVAFASIDSGIGSFWLSLVIASLALGLLGLVLEVGFLQRVYGYDHVMQLLLTFGFLLFLDGGARVIWGSDFKSVPTPPSLDFIIADVVPAYNVFIVLVGLIIFALIWYIFDYHPIGRKVRAASQDTETANALGINIYFIYTGVFVFGSALAGLSGGLATPYRSISPTMGNAILIESFVVVILGGIGTVTITGVLAISIAIGLTKSATSFYFPVLRPVITYLLLVAVILYSGSDLIEKVKQ